MTDIPDDLSDVGAHQGNPPPSETGQTVRSPEGPDPAASEAQPSPALFQVVRSPDDDRITVRAHSPRAEVDAPDAGDEMGRYRTPEELRTALASHDRGEGAVAVFVDAEADRVLVVEEVTADHAWIGQPRYPTVALFASHDAAEAYAETHERPRGDA